MSRRKRESPSLFPRCVLAVLTRRYDGDAQSGGSRRLVEQQESLARLLARLPPGLAPLLAEIAILSDGEPEATPPTELAAPGFSNVRWRANPRRYGYGGRRKVAFEYALEHGFDAVILLDEEAGESPEHLDELLAPLVLDGAEVVVASPRRPSLRERANTFLLNRVLGLRLSGFGSGARLYTSDVLRRIPYTLASDDRRFDTEILIQCRALGVPVREVASDGASGGGGSLGAAVDYRLHQLHVRRDGAFLVDHDVRYTLKRSPYGSHMQLLDSIRPGSRVLDLGCSHGLLAKPLHTKGVRIVGVDIGPPERVSSHLEAYYQRDLELPLEIPEQRAFDYVVLSDVIEHVKAREQLLRGARRYLKPEGRLLISTPNVALWFYRLSLLAGRFEYGPRGVLDETHVHLYTRSTFRREVERGGFRILAERVTSLPFEVVFESTGTSRLVMALSYLYHLCARAWPKMFAYQFVVEAEVTTLLDPDPQSDR